MGSVAGGGGRLGMILGALGVGCVRDQRTMMGVWLRHLRRALNHSKAGTI